MPTKSEQTNADITALLKSRHSLLWIVSREETRVERALIEAAAAADLASRLSSSGVVVSARRNLLRFSPHLYNGEADIDRAVEALERALAIAAGPKRG